MTLNLITKLLLPLKRKDVSHKIPARHIVKLKSGLLTVITALSFLTGTHGAVALSFNGVLEDRVTASFGTCQMQAILTAAGANVRLNKGTAIQVADGRSFRFSNGTISTTFPRITESFLETECGLSNVLDLTQEGASGTYATDDNLSVSFKAVDTATGNLNSYSASVTGVTNSTSAASVTLISAAPNTSFSFTPSGPITGIPAAVQFTDTTTSGSPIVQYSWNFGDGNTSSLQNPLHTYTEIGNFDITLNVTDTDGLQGSVTQSIAVTNPIGNTVTLSGLPAKTSGPQTITAVFSTGISSDFSTALALSDFSVSGATLSDLAGPAPVSGSSAPQSFSFTLTPDGSSAISLSLPAGVKKNAGNEFNEASNVLTADFDDVNPTVSIAAFTGAANGNQTAVITLSEDSTDFTQGDLSLTNATATLSGSGSSYTAVLTPLADGAVALSVAAGTFMDAAGNTNTVSNEVTTSFDATSPTVVLSSTTTSLSGPTSFDVDVMFDEAVTGFAAGDITVSNGAVTGLTGTGAAYVATIAATGGGGTVDISIAAAVATDIAGNDNEASNTLSIGDSTVEDTQRLIAQFQHSRATQLVSNQPNLTGFLSGEGTGGFFNADVTQGYGTFNFATAQNPDTSLWFRISGSIAHEGTSDTQYLFGAVGSHFEVSPNLLVGGLLEFDYLEQDDGAARIEGKGWLAGPYFVAKLPNQPVYFDGRLLYGQTSNDISPLRTYTDSFDTDRVLAQLKVSGALKYGPTTLRPSLQISYTTDDQKSYTDSLGNFIPDQGIELAQAELGMGFSHYLPLEDAAATLELTGSVAAILSSTSGSGNAALVVPTSDGGRARLNLGANYTLANGGKLVADTYYDGIGASGFESYGIQIGFNLTF